MKNLRRPDSASSPRNVLKHVRDRLLKHSGMSMSRNDFVRGLESNLMLNWFWDEFDVGGWDEGGWDEAVSSPTAPVFIQINRMETPSFFRSDVAPVCERHWTPRRPGKPNTSDQYAPSASEISHCSCHGSVLGWWTRGWVFFALHLLCENWEPVVIGLKICRPCVDVFICTVTLCNKSWIDFFNLAYNDIPGDSMLAYNDIPGDSMLMVTCSYNTNDYPRSSAA